MWLDKYRMVKNCEDVHHCGRWLHHQEVSTCDCTVCMGSSSLPKQAFLLAARPWGRFAQRERLRLSDKNSILMTKDLSGIRSEALIGQRSSYIVLPIVYEWQTKDKRLQRSNVNAMNLQQNSQYLRNIAFCRRSIWVLLELICKWTQRFNKIDQEKRPRGTSL